MGKTGYCTFCGEPFHDNGDGTRLPFCSFNCRQYYYMDKEEFEDVVYKEFYEGEIGEAGEFGCLPEQRHQIIKDRKQAHKKEVY